MEKTSILKNMFELKDRNSPTTGNRPVLSSYTTMEDFLIALMRYYNRPVTLTELNQIIRPTANRQKQAYQSALVSLEQSGIIYARQERPAKKPNRGEVSITITGRPKTIIALTSGYDYSA